MFFTKFSTALASILMASSFMVGNCDDDESATAKIVPVTSSEGVSVFVEGNVVPTQKHVVDPWVRPPRGVPTQQAIGMEGDFDGYPTIVASPYDSIEFLMRPVARDGDNTQRHGVYVITDKQLVQDYLDGKSEHPCGEPVYTPELLCQVVEYEGLNATDCPSRQTLFPLLEIFGASGEIGYTTSELGKLAEEYGIETESGSRMLAFDCPWIQGRNDEGSGRTSHCIGGMFQMVEVLSKEKVLEESSIEVGSGSSSSSVAATLFASAVFVITTALL